MALTSHLNEEKSKNADLLENFKSLQTAYKHSLANTQRPNNLDSTSSPQNPQGQAEMSPSQSIRLGEGERIMNVETFEALKIALQGSIKTLLQTPDKKKATKKESTSKKQKETKKNLDSNSKSQAAASPHSNTMGSRI